MSDYRASTFELVVIVGLTFCVEAWNRIAHRRG
jgi:hypothetical protein